jgi:predicted deacylase
MPEAPLPHTPTSVALHRFVALEPGPRLLLLGAVHGNETCGARALQRLVDELASGVRRVVRGAVTVVPVANPLAFARGERHGDRNLNRAMQRYARPETFEDRVANVLCALFEEHDALVDMHSFTAPGEPFVLIGPEDNSGDLEPFARAREEERLAAHLGPTRVIEGWMPTYARGVRRRRAGARNDAIGDELAFGVGTTERFRASGGYAVTIECGQHDDPRAPENAHRAATQALALLGITDDALAPPSACFEVLRLREVVDRSGDGDVFTRDWKSFDAVRAGERVGQFGDGAELRAPFDGRVVFPNPIAEPGTEWVYFAEPSARALRA